MTRDRQIKLIQELDKKALDLIYKKGGDYASEKDVLLNFKVLGEVVKILKVDTTIPLGVSVFYMILKIQRLCNLVFSDKEPNNESVQDTLIDLINYVKLCICILEESKSDRGKTEI